VKDRKSTWVVIEERERAADCAARQKVASFVFLERARAAAVVLNAAMAQPDFKAVLDGLVAAAEIKPKERDVVTWLLGSLEPTRPMPANGVPAHSAIAPSPAPIVA
jgi:hypothetical protein